MKGAVSKSQKSPKVHTRSKEKLQVVREMEIPTDIEWLSIENETLHHVKAFKTLEFWTHRGEFDKLFEALDTVESLELSCPKLKEERERLVEKGNECLNCLAEIYYKSLQCSLSKV